jgi:hypothetical protein
MKNNTPAFPSEITLNASQQFSGMTLRDYFAAKAVSAILDQMDVCNGKELTNAAWIAYQMADAMMKARTE